MGRGDKADVRIAFHCGNIAVDIRNIPEDMLSPDNDLVLECGGISVRVENLPGDVIRTEEPAQIIYGGPIPGNYFSFSDLMEVRERTGRRNILVTAPNLFDPEVFRLLGDASSSHELMDGRGSLTVVITSDETPYLDFRAG
jgi:hypothetical protein